MMVKMSVSFMSFSNPTCYFRATADSTVCTVCRRVKSAVALKWHIGFKNDTKVPPIFTIIFISKMLI